MATLTVDPTYVYEETVSFRTTITTYESGAEQRHAIGSPKHLFTLRFLNVSESIRDTLHNFHQARYGSYEVFQWVNPLDNVTYNVRFANDTMEENNISYGDDAGDRFNIECQLIEVI